MTKTRKSEAGEERQQKSNGRRIRYSVAMSLDGYIAGPNGEYDWITMDPDIDFSSMMNEFDTVLLGRKSFEATRAMGGGAMPAMKTIVVSQTLRPKDHPGLTILGKNVEESLRRVRGEPGKDIWLFGGGELFASLLAAGLVDAVEVAVVPVLLGGGIPLLPIGNHRAKLRLTKSRVYEKTGIVGLEYAIEPSKPARRNVKNKR